MKINVIGRIILFHFLIIYAVIKCIDFQNSSKDFRKKMLFYLELSSGYPKALIDLFMRDITREFIISICVAVLSSILAMFNYRIGKWISGLMTIMVGLIYYNPFTNIRKNIKKERYDMINYLPTIKCIIICITGIIMILTALTCTKKQSTGKTDKNKKE